MTAAKHYDIDRDVLVVNEEGTGGSLQMLEAYFEEVWSQRVSCAFRPRHVRHHEQTLEACRVLLDALAHEGQDIKIQSPHIIVDWSMIKPRAHVDGNHRVQLMTNAPEQGANPFGCSEYIGHRRAIVRAGVSVLEWMGGQSVHTKTMLIDGSTSIVGSYNLDLRSTYLDTELMLVIDSPARLQDLAQRAKEACKRGFARVTGVVFWPLRYLM